MARKLAVGLRQTGMFCDMSGYELEGHELFYQSNKQLLFKGEDGSIVDIRAGDDNASVVPQVGGSAFRKEITDLKFSTAEQNWTTVSVEIGDFEPGLYCWDAGDGQKYYTTWDGKQMFLVFNAAQYAMDSSNYKLAAEGQPENPKVLYCRNFASGELNETEVGFTGTLTRLKQ